MPKLNVNATTHDELVKVAELRPELAEAIIKFRDERGRIGSAEELDSVQGVGPATLERLREALSFGATAEEKAEREHARAEEKAAQEREQTALETAEKKAAAERDRVKAEEKAERERARAAQEEQRAAREAAEQAAAAARAASAKGVEMMKEATAKTVELGRGMVDAGLRNVTAMRPNFERAQKVVGALGTTQRETARKSVEDTAEFSKLAMDLFNEQTRQSMQVAMAFGRLVKWDEVLQLQSELVRASFERMNQLNSRYLELVSGVMTTATATTKDEFKKAA